ncbi:PDZ domain-containing protein [Synechococcus sp. AH-551-P21]|nr:PDZ domain-containing protein [Synechococcus sp. AH-551-P21]
MFFFRFKAVAGEWAVEVLRVIPGRAFAKAGFLKGDRIESIDGQGFSLGDARQDDELLGNAAKGSGPVRITYF